MGEVVVGGGLFTHCDVDEDREGFFAVVEG